MPTLIWIALWCSMVGTATCMQDAALPSQTKAKVKGSRDRKQP